jgi:hypothetical protein
MLHHATTSLAREWILRGSFSGEALEIASVVSAQREDAEAFERNMLQLKASFTHPGYDLF